MSWSNVKPYFKEILDAQDFSEWTDGFNIENIPSNILNRAYHVSITSITGAGNNQWDQETRIPVELTFFIKGYNDPSSAIDEALVEAEAIVKEAVRPSVRTTAQCIQNVIFNDLTLSPLDDSNDNAVLAQLNFEARVILETLT